MNVKLMHGSWTSVQRLVAVGIVSGLLVACAPTPVVPEGAISTAIDSISPTSPNFDATYASSHG